MAVCLRLKRFGRLNLPTYRLVAADSRYPRDGRIIEALGFYLPLLRKEDQQLKLNAERVSYWLGVGAQPSETVASLIRRAGIALPVYRQRKRKKSKAAAKKFVPPRKKTPKPNAAKAAAKKAKGEKAKAAKATKA